MIFLTGMVRSGTTFATRFVAEATGNRLAAQPLPLLYVEVMQRFRENEGLKPDGYPLSDCVFRNAYSRQSLSRFLETLRLSSHDFVANFEKNRNYSGQQTRVDIEPSDLRARESAGFDSLLHRALQCARFEGSRGFDGCKETSCEEFIPFLADRGWFVVLIIRDLRDVLCSLNAGKGSRFTGSPKPTLFNLRQWRKTVAFALDQGERPNVHVARFEDMLAKPEATGERLSSAFRRWAETQGWQDSAHHPRRQPGYAGNSSFGRGTSPRQRFAAHLDRALLDFVESLSWRELCAMGYQLASPDPPAVPTPEQFNDPFEKFRPELYGFRWNAARHDEERLREELLQGRNTSEDIERIFIFASVRDKLAVVPKPGG